MSGNGIHSNKSALQQDGVYDLPSTEYELVDPHSSCNDTLLEFHNPLYSDVGPVTFTETNTYGSVSCQQLLPLYACMSHGKSNTFPAMQTECGASAATRKYTYVPTIVSLSIIKRL